MSLLCSDVQPRSKAAVLLAAQVGLVGRGLLGFLAPGAAPQEVVPEGVDDGGAEAHGRLPLVHPLGGLEQGGHCVLGDGRPEVVPAGALLAGPGGVLQRRRLAGLLGAAQGES